MNTKLLIVISSVLLLAGISCSSGEATSSFPYGSYLYRRYNFLGELVGEGTLYISEANSNNISGNWQIREVRKCLNCGAQFGSGFFTGHIENDSIYINLNPDNSEIDTRLIGAYLKGNYNGDWSWTNQAGFGFSGTFKAVRQ